MPNLLDRLVRVNDELLEAAVWGRDLKRRRVYPWHVALLDAAEYILDPQIQRGEERLLFTHRDLMNYGHSERSSRTAREQAVKIGLLKVLEKGYFDPTNRTSIATRYSVNPDFLEAVKPNTFREVKAAIVQSQRSIGNPRGTFTYYMLRNRLEQATGTTTPQEVIEAYSKDMGRAIYCHNNDMKWGRFDG